VDKRRSLNSIAFPGRSLGTRKIIFSHYTGLINIDLLEQNLFSEPPPEASVPVAHKYFRAERVDIVKGGLPFIVTLDQIDALSHLYVAMGILV
jgi:hypothetical protein